MKRLLQIYHLVAAAAGRYSMAPSAYFNLVTSPSVFEAQYAAEGGKRFQEITAASASNWDREYLLACRVVRKPRQEAILPSLAAFVPTLQGPAPNDQMAGYLAGPDPLHRQLGESRLVHIYGVSLGQIWAALGAFEIPAGDSEAEEAADDNDDHEQPLAKRVRRSTVREGYVDSSTIKH